MYPSSPTCPPSAASSSSLSTSAAANFVRRPEQRRLVSPSSPAFSSSQTITLGLPPARKRLPGYTSLPPPAYCSLPSSPVATTPSVTSRQPRSPSPSSIDLSSRSSSPAISIELDQAREEAARARLAPLLFPKPRGVRSVVKSVFGGAKRRSSQSTRLEDLDDFEREIAQRMVGEVRVALASSLPNHLMEVIN